MILSRQLQKQLVQDKHEYKSRLGRARACTRPHKLVLVATRCTLVVLVRAVNYNKVTTSN